MYPLTLSVAQSSVFLELRSGKTVCFSEQIMAEDKYPSIFSCQMKAIVYVYVFANFQNCAKQCEKSQRGLQYETDGGAHGKV